MVAFVILHYQTIEETEKCVESVLAMSHISEIRVVIVDNASPNGTGKELQERWDDNEYVHVILNAENVGFSKGNNIGCMYARETWNPDFYVVANNDVIFTQNDFVQRIEKEYEKSEFYVLGPDIFDITNHVHQSPIGKCAPSKNRVIETIILNTVALKTFFISKGLLKKYYSNKDKVSDVCDYDIYQEDVLLMGACLIFSEKYIEERAVDTGTIKAFYPETKFYYEEAIMYHWCESNGKKIVYSPDIRVEHINGGATKTNRDESARIRSQMNNICDAAKIYLTELR